MKSQTVALLMDARYFAEIAEAKMTKACPLCRRAWEALHPKGRHAA